VIRNFQKSSSFSKRSSTIARRRLTLQELEFLPTAWNAQQRKKAAWHMYMSSVTLGIQKTLGKYMYAKRAVWPLAK
jgi:hypothetical protein